MSLFFSYCPWCATYSRQWCTLTDLCQIEVCTNCDHYSHEVDGCRLECPECGGAPDDDGHLDAVDARFLCVNVDPACAV